MLAQASAPAFKLRSHRGHLTMQELIAFAEHVAQIMEREVIMEGVQSVRPQADGAVTITANPLTEGDAVPSMNVNVTPRPRHTFPRAEGLALWQHLAAYHEFLWPQVESFRLLSKDIVQNRSVGPVQQIKFTAE